MLRVAYFGANFPHDIHATYEFELKLQRTKWPARWDPIAVIEEMSFEDKQFQCGVDPQLIKHDSNIWGTSYFYDSQGNDILMDNKG